jgi:oxygen-independent coproporphyrinogen III oxidase
LVRHLYVHYPFCFSKCNYCAFYSTPYSKDLSEKYLYSLEKELNNSLKKYDLSQLETIYIGGGNPSLNNDLIFINKIISSVNTGSIKEYTVECNPLTCNRDFIEIINQISCNRVSLGIQSFTQEALDFAGRINQNIDNVNFALKLLNECDISISIDLINGLPFSNIKNEIMMLDNIISKYKNINHISFYDLSLDEGSKFYKNNITVNVDFLEDYENEFKENMNKNSFFRYEVSNYSRNGHESKHNLGYWHYNNYLGLGPSAHSTIGNIRLENNPDIDKYINENDYVNIIKLTEKEQIEEYLLMGLRLFTGIKISDFYERFQLNIIDVCEKSIKKYQENNLMEFERGFIKVNNNGMVILNKILVDMFLEIDNIMLLK